MTERPFTEADQALWDQCAAGKLEALSFAFRALWLSIVRTMPRRIQSALAVGGWRVWLLVFLVAYWIPTTLLTALFDWIAA